MILKVFSNDFLNDSMIHSQLQALFSQQCPFFSFVSSFYPAFLTCVLHWKVPCDNPSFPNSRATAWIYLCAVRLSLKDELDHALLGAPHSRGGITASFWSISWRHKPAVHPGSAHGAKGRDKLSWILVSRATMPHLGGLPGQRRGCGAGRDPWSCVGGWSPFLSCS